MLGGERADVGRVGINRADQALGAIDADPPEHGLVGRVAGYVALHDGAEQCLGEVDGKAIASRCTMCAWYIRHTSFITPESGFMRAIAPMRGATR
jgi:hypothetical protein